MSDNIILKAPTLTEQNQRAQQNGQIGELFAASIYENFESINGLIDGYLDGALLEIKTCQIWIFDASAGKRKRRGRYYLFRRQHECLMEQNGYYCFVLLNHEQKVVFVKKMLARDVDIFCHPWCSPKKSTQGDVKQIIWEKIFDDFDRDHYYKEPRE